MVFALVVMLAFTVLGGTLWQVSSTDTVQVERDEDRAQAYYYAKSGVEIAVGNIMENIKAGIDYGDPDGVDFYGKLGESIFLNEATDDYNIKFTIKRKENDEYKIESTGIVRKAGDDGAQVASNALGFTISLQNLRASMGLDEDSNSNNGNNGGQMPPLDMIFALEGIDLSNGGSSEIHGNTGTNSIAPNSVVFASQALIRYGNLYIGPGADWDTDNVVVFNGHNRSPTTNIPNGTILNLSSTRNYPLPTFPAVPSLEAKDDMNAGWYPIPDGGHRISASGKYTNINVTNSLTIDIGNDDVIIQTQNLSVSGSGKIVLNKTGTGRLILYVLNTFNLSGSSTINKDGNYNDIYMYYQGNQSFDIPGATEFVGCIYTLNSDVTIRGSGGIKGHIITGGTVVNVTGAAEANVRAIYAPNALLTVTGSGSIKGALVAKKIKMQGNARVYYDNTMDLDFFEQLEWVSENNESNDETEQDESTVTNWWRDGKWINL